MNKKVLTRSEVPLNETWDLSRLYSSEELYVIDLEKLTLKVNEFVHNYEGKLNNAKIINESINDYKEILILITYTSGYQSLHASVDRNNPDNLQRSGEYSILSTELFSKLTFFQSELLEADDKVLLEVVKLNPQLENYISDIIDNKKHKVDASIEKALSLFSPVLNLPYSNYNSFKFGDMTFGNFNVLNNDYPNSFTMFENEWSYDENHEVRRMAYQSFYDDLAKYQTGFANNYGAHVLKEKAYAKLRNFNSTSDFLLYNQKVTREMYDRQIDLIMSKLAKPMRKYATLIKEVHGLDKLTYADLLISIDPEFEPQITIKEARHYAIESLKVFGSEYEDLVKRAFDERWIDFPQNLGKSTGGFCSSPYQKGSYILLNWNGQMNEAFVLAHELGHAGHFHYAGKYQDVLDTRTSLYFIEAPSTMNELVMAEYFSKTAHDLRLRRYVLSNLISRTYYHNMVTHLLEAHYQREVYRLVDNNQAINYRVLNDLKLKTLKEFWGDVVEIPDYAGLTWMRQPHYFMGLYPYTYSAGLTVSTTAFSKILKGEISYDDWLTVLKAGGTKTPLELAKLVNVNLETDKPLLETINYISDLIDEIVDITHKLNK